MTVKQDFGSFSVWLQHVRLDVYTLHSSIKLQFPYSHLIIRGNGSQDNQSALRQLCMKGYQICAEMDCYIPTATTKKLSEALLLKQIVHSFYLNTRKQG